MRSALKEKRDRPTEGCDFSFGVEKAVVSRIREETSETQGGEETSETQGLARTRPEAKMWRRSGLKTLKLGRISYRLHFLTPSLLASCWVCSMTDADGNHQTEGWITQITITEVKGQHGQWHTYNTFDHVQKPQIEKRFTRIADQCTCTNLGSHNDASHARQPLVNGERSVPAKSDKRIANTKRKRH